MQSNRDVSYEVLAIVSAWLMAIVFINPRGEFPLADDWDFTIATWNFARTGDFHFTPFTAVSLRAMVLWGAAWTRVLGESFLVLRLSTLTLAVVAIVVVHRTLFLAGLQRFARVTGTLAFAFHPVFLWSSCTYMTEVPFVCCSAIAILLLWRGIATQRLALVAAGSIAVLVSCFVRQTGIVTIFATISIVLLFRDTLTPRWRQTLAVLTLATAVFVVVWFVRPAWLAGSPAEFAAHYAVWSESSFRLARRIAVAYRYGVFNALNAALFSLPVVLPLVLLIGRRRQSLLLLALVIAVIGWRVNDLALRGLLLPYFAYVPLEDILPGNVFMNLGLGAPSLTDVWAMSAAYPFGIGRVARVIFTYASALVAGVMVWAILQGLARAVRNPASHALLLLCGSACGLATFALIASRVYCDRYALDSAWSVSIATALLVPWHHRAARVIAVVTLAVVALFGSLSVQEYFAWNRARWQLYRFARASGVPQAAIDGGNEATSFYEVSRMTRDQARRRLILFERREYLIAFNAVDGYRIIRTAPFTGWLGLHEGTVYLLRSAAP